MRDASSFDICISLLALFNFSGKIYEYVVYMDETKGRHKANKLIYFEYIFLCSGVYCSIFEARIQRLSWDLLITKKNSAMLYCPNLCFTKVFKNYHTWVFLHWFGYDNKCICWKATLKYQYQTKAFFRNLLQHLLAIIDKQSNEFLPFPSYVIKE